MLALQTEPVTECLRVRVIDDDEGRRLVRIVRRGSGSVVTWRRARMVLLSAQGMVRIAIICNNFSPHLTTAKDRRVGTWAAANNVEIACTPTNSSGATATPTTNGSAASSTGRTLPDAALARFSPGR